MLGQLPASDCQAGENRQGTREVGPQNGREVFD